MKTFFHTIIVGVAGILLAPAQWVYEPLYQFQRPGAVASAPLVVHSDGQIYGTAVAGGTAGGGTVFRLAGNTVVTVASLNAATVGSAPLAGLVSGTDGNLYGTCSSGGSGNFGTIFRVTPAGVVTKLIDFTGTIGAAPGSVPGELVRHPDGNFYGTTRAGGSGGHGVVFRLSPTGTYTVMANFTGTAGARRGSQPIGRLAVSGADLTGVTRLGGAGNFGAIFRINTTESFAFTNLGDFTGTAGTRPGSQPAGGLVLHSDGNFYGTAERGGANGFGTAFKLTPANIFTKLHDFADATASQPVGQLVEGSDGWLHGAAANGGSVGFGGVFRLSTGGVHELRGSFTGANGASPQAGPVRLADGNLLGVTTAGGPGQLGMVYQVSTAGVLAPLAPLSPAQGWHPSGAPAALPGGDFVFPVAFGGLLGGGTLTTWRESDSVPTPLAVPESVGLQSDGGLASFGGEWWGVASTGSSLNRGSSYSFSPANGIILRSAHTLAGGSRAEGPLVAGPDGLLHGVAREGGGEDRGTIFRLESSGVQTPLISFTGTSNSFPGRAPRGPLARASNGAFYGVTELGGSQNLGVIFKFTPPSSYELLAEFETSGPHSPRGGLIAAPNGLIYGTTSRGGSNDTGVMLQINPTNNTWSAVASFPANSGGPEGELVRATDGAILGFTTTGNSNGAVFRFSPGTASITFPATFTGTSGAVPGAALSSNSSGVKFTGGLREISPGRWIGVASGGGAGAGGVIFRLTNTSGSPFNAWLASELFGRDGSPQGDPDGDRIPNAVEYAIGSSPTIGNPSVLPQPSLSGGHLQIVVPRIPSRNDVTYVVESSTTLEGAWTPIATSIDGSPFSGPGYLSGETAGSSNKAVTVRLPQSVPSQPRGFLRLRVDP